MDQVVGAIKYKYSVI